MLFGRFHLLHAAGGAVSRYEKTYPNVTFVISDLGVYDANRKPGSSSPFAAWPNPSLLPTKGEVESAMKGHVIDHAELIGTYAKEK